MLALDPKIRSYRRILDYRHQSFQSFVSSMPLQLRGLSYFSDWLMLNPNCQNTRRKDCIEVHIRSSHDRIGHIFLHLFLCDKYTFQFLCRTAGWQSRLNHNRTDNIRHLDCPRNLFDTRYSVFLRNLVCTRKYHRMDCNY